MFSFLQTLLFASALSYASSVADVIHDGRAYAVKEQIIPLAGWPNFSELERHLYEVSDPAHERYGQHLSKKQVEGLVAPHPDSLYAVNEWLSSFGFIDKDLVRSPAKDWITLNATVSMAERMLNTTYHVWKHVKSGDYLVRTTSYSLPVNLHGHIDLIQPTTMFGRFKPPKSAVLTTAPLPRTVPQVSELPKIVDSSSGVTVDASCNQTITITCLQQIYNAVGFLPTAKGNTIGVSGYLGQFANNNDLQLFFADQLPDAVNSTFTFVSIAGGMNGQDPDDAGNDNLDIEFASGLSHPIPPTFFSTAGSPLYNPDMLTQTDSNEPYTTWLDFVLEMEIPPLAISTSYVDDEQTVPISFATRICQGFAQLGARGVSLLFDSGGGGVGDGDANPATQECFANDGTNQTKFIPGFPASCPFVTAVGGTVHFPEQAALLSGGGFSNYFSRPPYQELAVLGYLATLPLGTYTGLFNPNGRAIPDVSAQSDNFKVVTAGQTSLAGGTYAATPTFTAFVALLNDVRLTAGLPALGFLNPFLYSIGLAGMNDVTTGNNPGCGTPGFSASKGWDPVTGLGTPNFGKLGKLVGGGLLL